MHNFRGYRRTRLRRDTHQHKKMQMKAIFAAVKQWLRRSNERHCLEYLTERELRDMGLDFDQARIEATKPFWRV